MRETGTWSAPAPFTRGGVLYQVVNNGHGVLLPQPLPAFIVAAITGRADRSQRASPFTHPPVPKDHSWWRDGEVIPRPDRHQALIAAAGYCRKVGLSRDMAIPTIRDVFRRCCPGTCCRDKDGNPAKTYSWEQALAKLDDAYARYPAGEPRAPVQTASATGVTAAPAGYAEEFWAARGVARSRTGRRPGLVVAPQKVVLGAAVARIAAGSPYWLKLPADRG